MTDRNQPTTAPAERDYPEDEIDLRRLIDIVIAGKWIIAGVTGVCVLLALFYLLVTAPVYRADALLQIQSESSGAIQGLMQLEQTLTGESKSQAQSEMQIIRSRSVLGSVVERLGLEVAVEPEHFPIIGSAVARWRGSVESEGQEDIAESGWFPNYAWSRAAVDIGQLEVPQALMGQALTLTALGGGRYRLYDPEGEPLLDGEVGQSTVAETPYGPVTLFVAGIETGAAPVDFTVVKQPWLRVVQALNNRLGISEQGRDTGIVQIALEGHDRARITEIVNAVAQTYLRQNVEARTEEAERSLAFLEEQLPELRDQLRQSEEKLNRFQEQKHAINLDAEAQALLEQSVALEQRLLELDLQRNQLRQRYRPNHPELQVIADQIQEIRAKRQELEQQVGGLPSLQREIISLRRDVEVNTALYTSLLNRSQELKVLKAGTTGNVRIVDAAVLPIQAVKPRKALTGVLALMLGGMLGVGVVFGRAALRRGVADPGEIERETGLPVYGVVPFSYWQQAQVKRAGSRGQPVRLLARERPEDVVTEALRSLRTSLHFAQMNASENMFLFTGPGPGMGKTFVSVNLAALLEEAGKQVVFVDADMRRGALQNYTGGDRANGLSNILSGQIPWRDAVSHQSRNGISFDIITSGEFPPNPAELLMRPSTEALFRELKDEYDIVIVDAPPILAVTDPVILAGMGAVTFLVARAGVTPMQEIEVSIQRLAQNGSRATGVILNGLRQNEGYGVYGYYPYAYKSDKPS